MSVLKFIVLLLFSLLVVATVMVVSNNTKLTSSNQQRVEALWRGASDAPAATFDPEQTADLPPVVKNYFLKVLPEGVPLVRRIRLEQHGTFNVGEEEPQWLPLQAIVHITTQPPGMIWQAHLSLAPPLYIRVIDSYHQGKGELSGSVLGTFSVIDATSTTELDQGELMTWLAEAVWYPTALLPGNGVSWEAIDKRRARATVDDGHNRISLDFHFNDSNEVVRVDTPARAREVDGRYELLPWSCHYREYEKMDGVLVPREGEAIWHLPSGEWPYLRARIDSLQYDPHHP